MIRRMGTVLFCWRLRWAAWLDDRRNPELGHARRLLRQARQRHQSTRHLQRRIERLLLESRS